MYTGLSPAEIEIVIDAVASSKLALNETPSHSDAVLDHGKYQDTFVDGTVHQLLSSVEMMEEKRSREQQQSVVKAEAQAMTAADRALAEQQTAREEADYHAAMKVAGPALASDLQERYKPAYVMEELGKLSSPERHMRRDELAEFFQTYAEVVENGSDFPGREGSIRALRGLEKRWRDAGAKYSALKAEHTRADEAGRIAIEQQIDALFQPLVADSKSVLEPGMRPILERIMPAVEGRKILEERSPGERAASFLAEVDEISRYLDFRSGRTRVTDMNEAERDYLDAAWGDYSEDDLELIKAEKERRSEQLTRAHRPGSQLQ